MLRDWPVLRLSRFPLLLLLLLLLLFLLLRIVLACQCLRAESKLWPAEAREHSKGPHTQKPRISRNMVRDYSKSATKKKRGTKKMKRHFFVFHFVLGAASY
jgi:hypothetical protein